MNRIKSQLKDLWIYWKDIIFLILVAISIITVIFFFYTVKEREYKAKNDYNDGICIECGGPYEFFQVVGRRNGISYIYKCKNCDYIIESATYHR